VTAAESQTSSADQTTDVPNISSKPDFAEKSRFKSAPKTTVKLTDLLKVDSKKESPEAENKVEADQPFTPEQLQATWNEYTEQRKKFQAEYQLLSQPYELVDGKIIHLPLYHPVQETMLNNLRIELSTFLRERLRNSSIQLVGKMIEETEAKRVYYTNREKFDYLVEKNPILKELKDRLGLDTDY